MGLATALFLFQAGLTGIVIAWAPELDAWLNPSLFAAPGEGAFRAPGELAAIVEASDPRAKVIGLPLVFEPGDAAMLEVVPRLDSETGAAFELPYDQVFVDPVTGRILGTRDRFHVSLAPEHIVQFLITLHYSMHVPAIGGTDRWGMWLMGVVAILWSIDCVVGLALTLPRRRAAWWTRWRPVWRIKRGAGGYRLNLDLHRASGLWLWLALFMLAITSVTLNFYGELARPVVGYFSELTPSPYETRDKAVSSGPLVPALDFAPILGNALAEARRRGWAERPFHVRFAPGYGIYNVGFLPFGRAETSAGLGPRYLYFDHADGRLIGASVPGTGSAGDLYFDLYYPLHTGQIAGLPGRMFISVTGLAVALLSITGIVVWWRKRAVRARWRNAAPAG